MSHEIFLVACVLLSSAGAPEHLGSLVTARGLGYSAACGILFPRPGIEPGPSAVRVLITEESQAMSLLQVSSFHFIGRGNFGTACSEH